MCVSHNSFFFILKYTIKLSTSFLADNQPTIAKMDNFPLLQILERFPELRLKYMGSYPSDTVPQLTKYSFANINSAQSNDRGEHWIMIARLDKSYSFADSLGRKRSTYPFLTMVPRKLQKTDNLCGFYATCSAFLLFKFFQKSLNHVDDVHVLNFISKFM